MKKPWPESAAGRISRTGMVKLALFMLLSVLVPSCVQQPRVATKIKVLSLNPDEYLGNRVFLSGKVQSVGPAEAYLVVEDDTGRIMVGTEQIAQKAGCPTQAKIELAGTLRTLKSVSQPYFSMDSLVECKP